MILQKHALVFAVFICSVLADADIDSDSKIDEVKENAKESAKNNVEEKVATTLTCYRCSFNSFSNDEDTDKCLSPTQNTPFKVCPDSEKCFSFATTKSVEGQDGTIDTIARNCGKDGPRYNELKKEFENADKYCGEATSTFKNNATVTTQTCGSVCEGSFCNTDIPTESSGLSTGAIVGISIGSIIGLLLIVGLVVYLLKYHGREKVPTHETEMMN